MDAMIIFAQINPKPYSVKMKMLLVGFLAIPKDQKKKIALSSHGIAVWRIPNKKAGIKIIKYSWTIFSINRPLDSNIIIIN